MALVPATDSADIDVIPTLLCSHGQEATGIMAVSRLLVGALLLAAVLGTAGCGSVSNEVPGWAGGLPPDAPPRRAAPPPYPDVNDVPPPRPAKLMTEQEQTRLESELTAVRNRVNRQTDALEREKADDRR